MKRREAFQRIILAGGTVLVLPAALLSCSENEDEGPGGNNSNNDLKIDMSDANYTVLLNDGGFVVVSGMDVQLATVPKTKIFPAHAMAPCSIPMGQLPMDQPLLL